MQELLNEMAEHKEMAIAALVIGLIVGCIGTCIVPIIRQWLFDLCDWSWKSFASAFNNPWQVWLILTLQIGLEIFLLMQWIFVYYAITEPKNVWNQYAYLPLTVVVPLFFANILAGVCTVARVCKLNNIN